MNLNLQRSPSLQLKPILTPGDHVDALIELDRLWSAQPGTPEHDRFEVLSVLVEDYERKQLPAPYAIDAQHWHSRIAGKNFGRRVRPTASRM